MVAGSPLSLILVCVGPACSGTSAFDGDRGLPAVAELRLHEQYKLIERGSGEATAAAAADDLMASVRGAFDDALVTGWEPLDGTFGLPDVDDEHVVAAAGVGDAGAIVTDNLKAFPLGRVPAQIQVLPGRESAANTADVDPERAARALREMSRRRTSARQSAHDLVALLVDRYGMHEVAEAVLPCLTEQDLSGESLE